MARRLADGSAERAGFGPRPCRVSAALASRWPSRTAATAVAAATSACPAAFRRAPHLAASESGARGDSAAGSA
eukprot:3059883-Pleurochrysis_carterae.AAC.3